MSRFDNNCLWITGGVHDGIAVAVLVSVIGGKGEPAHLRFPDPVVGGVSYDATEFDSVDEFHF